MSRQTPSEPDPTNTRPTVFFDGACPLCRREIAHYRRIDRAQRLHWVDATTDAEILAAHGLDLERAMAELHVLDGNGDWHHLHQFERRHGGTLLHDEVHYALPLALVGPARELVHTLYVRPALEHIFDYRRQIFTRLFGGIQTTGAQPSTPAPATEENIA